MLGPSECESQAAPSATCVSPYSVTQQASLTSVSQAWTRPLLFRKAVEALLVVKQLIKVKGKSLLWQYDRERESCYHPTRSLSLSISSSTILGKQLFLSSDPERVLAQELE